ncbi:MAG: YqeG family HAD IIIA-type phosphatase [Chloroflexi bacterium]|nr:YqeG family HAD IIIA-type phosphatase [Chloroflexota bacterium]
MNFKKLCPRMVVEKVQDIDLQELKDMGFRYLLLDLDNTLLSWWSGKFPPMVKDWIEEARGSGFELCIVSNSLMKWKVKRLGRELEVPAINRASKPRKGGLLKAMDILGAKTEETVVIGDQIFTDILGGNRLGMYTILVRPVSRHEFFATVLQRAAEKLLIFRWKKKGVLKEVEGKKGIKYISSWEGK